MSPVAPCLSCTREPGLGQRTQMCLTGTKYRWRMVILLGSTLWQCSVCCIGHYCPLLLQGHTDGSTAWYPSVPQGPFLLSSSSAGQFPACESAQGNSTADVELWSPIYWILWGSHQPFSPGIWDLYSSTVLMCTFKSMLSKVPKGHENELG